MSDKRYVITLSVVEGVSVDETLVRAHVAHLKTLEASNDMELCGPFTDQSGGMMVIRAISLAAAIEFAEADPFVSSGARSFEVRELELSHPGNNHLGMG